MTTLLNSAHLADRWRVDDAAPRARHVTSPQTPVNDDVIVLQVRFFLGSRETVAFTNGIVHASAHSHTTVIPVDGL